MIVGVVGAGRIGSLHAGNLEQLPLVDQVVVADSAPGRAQELAARLGVEAAESPARMIAGGIDGLVIAVGTDAHQDLIREGAEAGIPMFCEKPLALELSAVADVVRMVEQMHATVQVGFQRRFDPGYLAAREAVRAGELGWLHTVWASTLDPAPPPEDYIAGSGGLFRDCSVHDVDALRWVTGSEVRDVVAIGANRGGGPFALYGDVDTGGCLLSLVDGTIAFISGTRYNGNGYDVRMELLGSSKSMVVGLDERSPLRSAEPGVGWPSGIPYADFIDRFRGAYLAELESFTQLVAGKIDNPCPASDSLETAYVVEACDLARREQRRVEIEELRL